MTNFEIYKDDLMKIKGRFAFNKNTRKIVRCDSHIDCGDCIFNSKECLESNKIEWLYEEHKPPVLLSDDEIELIKAIGKAASKEYRYVVRDADGVIRLFAIKPRANKTKNYYSEYGYTYIDIGLEDKILFSNITQEDGIYDIKNQCFIKGKDI